MTDIEILERAENYVGVHYRNGVEDAYINPCLWRAIDKAISALRTQQEAEKNEPLTLDELREMDGEPVWVETPGVDREISGRWVIVDEVNLEKKVLFTRGDFTCHDYGKVWLAYRRKPEEGSDA